MLDNECVESNEGEIECPGIELEFERSCEISRIDSSRETEPSGIWKNKDPGGSVVFDEIQSERIAVGKGAFAYSLRRIREKSWK